ncbi:hypothetical protein B5P46_01640 [Rhizobium leguminosarum]|uniref:Tetratricopeptide repeat protein n=1 Tax=Rhizobium leguminosarum TaxID=384 RepID=A0A4Q1UCM4_RHILE|nr:hypothetical protein [Rhizobium leguminosarum]RXT29802.1 hypothetical protein B5P46_01640 [Rhizobium leguminosarum]
MTQSQVVNDNVAWIETTATAHAAEAAAMARGLRFNSVVRIEPDPKDTLIGFSAVRPAVSQAIVDLEANGHIALLTTLATELVWLFPSLRGRVWTANALDLEAIALPPSRRRLHKESEAVQRVVISLVRLLRAWRAEAGGKTLLHFYRLQEMDEHSARLLRRMVEALPGSDLAILASLGGAPSEAAPAVEGALREHIDVGAFRSRMLARLRKLIRPEILQSPANPNGTHDVPVLRGLPDAFEIATAEARARAAFSAALLSGGDGTHVGRLAAQAVAASVFTLNLPLAIATVAELGDKFSHIAAADRHEIALQVGFAHAFSTSFESARQALEVSAEFAETTEQRAATHFYLALVHIKRLGNPVEGRQHVDVALDLLEAAGDAAHDNEIAWLYNLKALSFVEEKNLAAAGRCLHLAVTRNARPARSSDQVHLKLNLLNNITLLEEISGRYDQAIARYAMLEPLMRTASPSAAKHWHYRLGALMVRCGRREEGIVHLEAAHASAERDEDLYYCDRIAADIAAVQEACGDRTNATLWYRRAAAIEREIGNATGLDHVNAALARMALLPAMDDGKIEDDRRAAPESFRPLSAIKTRLNQPFHQINLY